MTARQRSSSHKKSPHKRAFLQKLGITIHSGKNRNGRILPVIAHIVFVTVFNIVQVGNGT